MLISQIKYFNSTGGTFISAGYGHARANFLKMRKISYEVFTQIQYDHNRDMNNRYIFGGGLRWKISNTDKSSFFIGTELMFEHERWDNPEVNDEYIIKDLGKFSSYFSIRQKTSEISAIRSVVYYQTGYDPEPGIMRNRVSYDVQFEMEIMRKLLLTVKFAGAFEDQPIYPINKFIYSIENGLVWKF